jgi:hypothetical protein
MIDQQIAVRVDSRAHVFHDNDPGRTKRELQHIWLNSRLNGEFIPLLDEALEQTKDELMKSRLNRNSAGQQKGWPYAIQVLGTLIRERVPA